MNNQTPPPAFRFTSPMGRSESDFRKIASRRDTPGSRENELTTSGKRVVFTGKKKAVEIDSKGKFSALLNAPPVATSASIKKDARSKGEEIGSRIATMSKKRLRDEIGVLTSMTQEIRSKDVSNASGYAKHDKKLQSVLKKRKPGEGISEDTYRTKLWKSMDETNATSPYSALLSGMLTKEEMTPRTGKKAKLRESMVFETARFVSSQRTVTEHVKTRVKPKGSTDVFGSDHPTSKTLDKSRSKPKNSTSAHSYSDRRRAERGVEAIGLGLKGTRGVAAPLVLGSLSTRVEHHTTMILPSRAKNISLDAPRKFKKAQTGSREVSKVQTNVMEGAFDSRPLPPSQGEKRSVKGGHSRASSPERR